MLKSFCVVIISGVTFLATMGISEHPPGWNAAETASAVQARIAELKAQSLTASNFDNPRFIVTENGDLAVASDLYSDPSGTGEFASITLADDCTMVVIDLWHDGGAWKVLRLWKNGDLVTSDEPLGIEIGRVYHYVDPERAKIDIEGKILAAQCGEHVSEVGTMSINPLTPEVPLADGITVLYFPEGQSKGLEMLSIGTVVIIGNTGGSMSMALVGPPAVPVPIQKVCEHLFDVCVHGSGQTAIYACELFLKYCVQYLPPGPSNPGAQSNTPDVGVTTQSYGYPGELTKFGTISLSDREETAHVDLYSLDGGNTWSLSTLFVNGQLAKNEPIVVELGVRLLYSQERIQEIHNAITAAESGVAFKMEPLDVQPLTPESVVAAPGITLFYFPEGEATGEMTISSQGSGVIIGHDGHQVVCAYMFGPPGPVEQICAHLYRVCTTGSSQAAIQACELWLKYCAKFAAAR